MPIEIRRTKVTPAASGSVVELHISDAPPDDGSATFVVTILATLPAYNAPALGQLQRAAMRMAQDELTPILQAMASELRQNNLPIDPQAQYATRR